MKTNMLKLAAVLAWPLLMACEDEQEKPVQQQADPETQHLVLTKNHLDNVTIGLFANKFRGNVGGREARGPHRFSGLFKGRSEAQRAADFWETCALVTIIENPSNTWTVVLDFGEQGCVDDGKIRTGKVAFTGSETDSSGVFQIAFENFSEYDANETPEDPLRLNGFYQGNWSADPSAEYTFYEAFQAGLEVLHQDGFKEGFIAEGEVMGNTERIVVTKHNFHGENSDGESFSGLVAKSLVFDLTCEDTEIYTEGTEVYQVNGKAVAIDYGNGTCDHIVTLQADGIIVIVDLDKVNS